MCLIISHTLYISLFLSLSLCIYVCIYVFQNPFGGGFGGFGGFGGQQGFHYSSSGGGDQINVEDLMNMFGMNMGPRRGQNVNVSVNISFLEAVNGCEKEIKYSYSKRDNPKARPTNVSKELKFSIPGGVENGMTLRVEGKGGEGMGSGTPNGDLLITLGVQDDPFFKREQSNVHVDVPISLVTAIVGGKVDVLTLDGLVELKIPPGTQPDANLLMRGKGIKKLGEPNKRGNQYCHIKIKIPSKLTDRQREIITEFDKEQKNNKSGEDAQGEEQKTSLFESALNRVKEMLSRDKK
jgi:DnaJ-class molecular chaperone